MAEVIKKLTYYGGIEIALFFGVETFMGFGGKSSTWKTVPSKSIRSFSIRPFLASMYWSAVIWSKEQIAS